MNRRVLVAAKVLVPLAIVVAAALGALALTDLADEPRVRRPDVLPPAVRIAEVELVDLDLEVTSQGTVQPRTESRLVPEVSGRVVWVSPALADGGFFDAGDPLLRIDSHDYEQAVVRARAEVAAALLRLAEEEAEADLAREEWEDLGVGEAPPLTVREPQLANARAALAAAEATLARAERDLARTEIRAPYDGRVREEDVDLGQFVTVGAPLATVYAVDAAEIRLPLPDDQLAFVDIPLSYRDGPRQRGGPAVTLEARFAGRLHRWQGRIVRTEAEIDPDSRMVHAVARVDDPYGRGGDPERPPLAVGMFVEAAIHGRTVRDVATLPRAALRYDGSVLVVDEDDRLRLRRVEVLRTDRDRVIVSAGLATGERVCLSPLDTFTEGMRVRPLEGGDVESEPSGEPLGTAATEEAGR